MFTNTLDLDPRELSMVKELKSELGFSTTAEALQVIQHILSCIGDTLSPKYATKLVRKLPDLFKLMLASTWKTSTKLVKINHLDELVTAVLERDLKGRQRIFKRETQALSAVVITLKRLEKMMDLQHFEGLSPSIRKQLSEVYTGQAA